MKMKKFLLVGLLGVVTLCGLSSCDDDDDGGYVPFSYAVGDMVVKDGSEPYIQLDSKQTLFPFAGREEYCDCQWYGGQDIPYLSEFGYHTSDEPDDGRKHDTCSQWRGLFTD